MSKGTKKLVGGVMKRDEKLWCMFNIILMFHLQVKPEDVEWLSRNKEISWWGDEKG